MCKDVLDNFEDALFPEYGCFACGREILKGSNFLCDKCNSKIVHLEEKNACRKCGAPLNGDTKICDDCKFLKFNFDEARACVEYEGKSKDMILGIKYSRKIYLAKYFAKLMYEKLSKWGVLVDFIVPVPLSDKRFKQRGYNQSEVIANELSLLSGIPVNTKIIKRVDGGKIQQGLSRKERIENMKGAFVLEDKSSLIGKNILILDDVFTTGATVNELSRMLKKLNPDKIFVLTVGKQLFKDKSANKKNWFRRLFEKYILTEENKNIAG